MEGQGRTFEYSIRNDSDQPVTQEKSQDNATAFFLAPAVHNAVGKSLDAALKGAEIQAGNRGPGGKANGAYPPITPERGHNQQCAYQ